MRVVLDTNVLVSMLIGRTETMRKLREAMRSHQIEVCLSTEILEELQEVLWRPKLLRILGASGLEGPTEFIEELTSFCLLIQGPLKCDPVIASVPDDDTILATAIAARADVIVSGDEHLLQLCDYRGIPIMNSRQFLDSMER